MLFDILFQNILSLYITGVVYIYRIFITFFFKTHICHMLFYTKCIFKWAMMRFGNSNSDILKILSLISLFILHCLVLVFANMFNCGSTSAHRLAELLPNAHSCRATTTINKYSHIFSNFSRLDKSKNVPISETQSKEVVTTPFTPIS